MGQTLGNYCGAYFDRSRRFWLFVLAVFFCQPALSYVNAPEVKKIVEENTQQLVVELEKSRDLYFTEPARFYSEMEKALEEVVDFRRIAARVMGRYARQADRKQRDLFVETFKVSLFSTYARALVESGDFKIAVLDAKMISARNDRASVALQVTSENGNTYPVVYSMYLSSQRDVWLLENMIVNGVNLGLAFRDRFEEEVHRYKGNLDAVIANWNADLSVASPGNQ